MKKSLNIGVVYGGWSSEREVSIRSGKNVLKALKEKGYNSRGIDITRDNIKTIVCNNNFDTVFLLTHGRGGEDGTIQGLFESLGINYTGSDVTSSALCMDKILTKYFFSGLYLPTPPYKIVSASPPPEEEYFFPSVIKPRREGSSVGVSILSNKYELQEYLQNNIDLSKEFLLEQYIKGREFTCGIIGTGQRATALPVLEIKPKNTFYDYEAKYTEGKTEFIVPAKISDSLSAEIKELSLKAYRAAGCRDFGRVDSIVSPDGTIFLLEINTLPGMTNLSDLPMEARAAGMSYQDLVEKILLSSLERI